MRRVGHKGADGIVSGNTMASFDAALDAGVDMIEFDVLREPGTGRLVLAHDLEDARSREAPLLADGLAHLAGVPGVELDVDLKAPGYELAVLEALRSFDLLGRTIVSSQYRQSLALIRGAEPELRLGWSVPRVRRDPFASPATAAPALMALAVYRVALPGRAAAAIQAGAVNALMAQWRLVTPRLVRGVHRAGGELYVWTVDDPGRITRLERLGVDGLITNDPRLFGTGAQPITQRSRL